MKIKDLADGELKNLAIKRASENFNGICGIDEIMKMNLSGAFKWHESEEGSDFWVHVNNYGEAPKGYDASGKNNSFMEKLNENLGKVEDDKMEKLIDGTKDILTNKDGSVIVNFVLGVVILLSLSLLFFALTILFLLSIVGLTLKFVFVSLPVKIYSMFKNAIKK